jgi:hypothetical protein
MGHIQRRLELGEVTCFHEDVDGVLWFKNRLVIPKDFKLYHKIMDEAHCSRYSIHLETNKMYQDLKKNFWWTRMKREIAKYVAKCDTGRRVKADRLRPTGNLQPLKIPEWKWEDICMDFIMCLPCTSRGYNTIWVIMDCLTKSAHFIPVATMYKVRQYAELYITHIVRYHGVPKIIISDRGSIFITRILEQLHDYLGTHLIRSSAYHPQTDGQTERVNQIIEDMLRVCVPNDGSKWDQHLPLVEFSNNNSYQEIIKMSSFKALYGCHGRTPLSWSKSGERVIFGPDIMIEAEEKVKQIHANMLTAQSQNKIYAYKRRCSLEYKVSDHIYLRISPMKGVRRFGIKGKLAPHYIGSCPILEKCGSLAYRVELPSELSGIHNVFHASQLKRCLKPMTDMVVKDTIPLEPDLTYKAYLFKILEQQD